MVPGGCPGRCLTAVWLRRARSLCGWWRASRRDERVRLKCGGVGRVKVAESFGRRRVEHRGGVLEVGNEAALEPAEQALLVAAGERRGLRALGLRDARAVCGGDGAGPRPAVEVGRADDEGVAQEDEQHEGRRRRRRRALPDSDVKSELQGLSALREGCGTNITPFGARLNSTGGHAAAAERFCAPAEPFCEAAKRFCGGAEPSCGAEMRELAPAAGRILCSRSRAARRNSPRT